MDELLGGIGHRKWRTQATSVKINTSMYLGITVVVPKYIEVLIIMKVVSVNSSSSQKCLEIYLA